MVEYFDCLPIEDYMTFFFFFLDYYVEWNGRWIHVFRPDVECTNGIIHVIDEPFLLDSDIRATGKADKPTMTYSLVILIISYAFVKLFEN